jgi:hypothetical protein
MQFSCKGGTFMMEFTANRLEAAEQTVKVLSVQA